MSLKILVMKKDGVWYVKHPRLEWTTSVRVDGHEVQPCRDARWGTLPSQPVRFDELCAPPRKLTGFKRLEQYKDLELPLGLDVGEDELPHDDEVHDSDLPHAKLRSMYEPVYHQPKQFWQQLDWHTEVVDLDCEPVTRTIPVKIDFPYCVTEYPECHHKYPCSLPSDELFSILWHRVAEVVDATEELRRNDFYNIQTLTVKRRMKLVQPKQVKRDVSSVNARKPKYKMFSEDYDWRIVFTVRGSYANSDAPRCPTLKADNYNQMSDKVEEYVSLFLEQLDSSVLVECERCNGQGWHLKENYAKKSLCL